MIIHLRNFIVLQNEFSAIPLQIVKVYKMLMKNLEAVCRFMLPKRVICVSSSYL